MFKKLDWIKYSDIQIESFSETINLSLEQLAINKLSLACFRFKAKLYKLFLVTGIKQEELNRRN